MAQNQNSGAVQTVTMDSRKFLGQLNDSAQAKVAFFEERVQQMGQQAGRQWRLAALHAKDLFIEDINSHDFYVAEHSRDHGKVTITNIRPVRIVEGEKKDLFEDAALKLITALESNDQREMASAFNRLKVQRFSSRAVPMSGMVRCRDGVLRYINISTEGALDEGVRDRLVAVIVESLRDRVIVENGHVVAGYFGDDEVKLPVTRWAARKLVARRMRDAAQNAYWSEGFQQRVYGLARLVSEGKIEEAVKSVTDFLDEMEEFTLLTRQQTQTLVENALAARAVFNQQLCTDTATLFYRTNLRVNKQKIVEEWRHIAKKAEHSVLAENVHILEQAKNFEATYDKFLKLIFEAISNREVAAEALATTLAVLRDRTPKIKESHELSSKLQGLVNRLKQRDFDDAAIYEAEDLIATIQEELGAADTLANFDQMPGDMNGMDPLGGGGTDQASLGGSGTPIININSPLIQIGGTSAAGGAEGGAQPPQGGAAGAGSDPELEALLGGGAGGQQSPQGGAAGGGAPPGGAMPPAGGQQPLMQGRDRSGNVLGEGVPPWRAGHGNAKERPWRDDHPSDFEGFESHEEDADDPYALKKDDPQVPTEGLKFTDYGAPVITDDGDLDRILRIMRRLATEHRLTGKALHENLENMAKASIKAIGLRIPNEKLGRAIREAVTAFAEEWQKPWLKKNKDNKDDEEEEDEGVAEDQYKIPMRKPRGMARANLGREMPNNGQAGRKGSSSESIDPRQAIAEGITWGQAQEDAVLGELAGVRFIFDHGGDSEMAPVILSEDGAVEIPVPQDLYDDAFAAANMTEGDGSRFVQWLAESIEQLRPIADAEDRALEEAVAKITAGPDGTLSVEVTPDVGVSELDDQGGGDTGMETGMEAGTEEEAGMAPVDATDPGAAVTPTGGGQDGLDPTADATEEQMPDFEAGGGTGMEQPPTAAAPADPAAAKPVAKPAPKPQEDDGVHFEDRDMTAPPSSKYTTHVKDNKRKMPDVKVPGKTDDKLDAIGPDLKTDDGSGSNPPTAKKGSDE
jgi:hypothetical protein